ncbi:cytochrome c peroxidase [Gemmatimonas aurantiaca]|uniref:cytochrome-c peroxidase n=1 Tax=Gemmatimonas aurantiaca TaxID=173480 RepID=UPI00301DB999
MSAISAMVMPRADTLMALGRQIFFDSTLSASGRLSCASCHDQQYGWAAPNALAVQTGGIGGTASGLRAVPSLGYAQDTPPFTEHYREDDGDDSEDQGAAGGLMWDGRAESLKEQAALPLLSPLEMGNISRAAAVERLRVSAVAEAFRTAFGAHVFDDSLVAWNGLLAALDAFQQSPADFYPYSSKYDAFLRGEGALTARERRGLALFNDPAKGNCASCHPSARQREGFPQFTDRGFLALGVPRNRRIPVNADSTYYDLGLCGPLRTDLADRPDYCGAFKTPTLRNVARRQVFFHNGVFTSLEQVLRFYARRDTEGRLFYPVDKRGVVQMYDDLPRIYWDNLNVDPPFDRKPGQRPAFSDAEAADMIAFLRTLNDGYSETTPARR